MGTALREPCLSRMTGNLLPIAGIPDRMAALDVLMIANDPAEPG
jgi:hypothetical protein